MLIAGAVMSIRWATGTELVGLVVFFFVMIIAIMLDRVVVAVVFIANERVCFMVCPVHRVITAVARAVVL
ncbi:MAG: hypothetical protein CMF24_08670 [Ilumatobacter sp.]|nr:hypothetical protein [Ilumatobacter sp.]